MHGNVQMKPLENDLKKIQNISSGLYARMHKTMNKFLVGILAWKNI